IQHPVRTREDVGRLTRAPPQMTLAFVLETIRLARAELGARAPLIGFAGAPFTLASYLVEGRGSRNYVHTKTLMYGDPRAWHALMEHLGEATVDYVRAQVAAGAQAVQLFDSWIGCLGPDDYREYVLPHMRNVLAAIAA